MRLFPIIILFFTSLVSSTASAEFIDFELNNSRFCGLLEDGKVNCTRVFNADSPTLQPDPSLTFTQIQGGNYYACGITSGGVVECWGDEPNEGQTNPPVFNSTVVELSVGPYHACAIDDEGVLKCWGQNVHGQTEPPAAATDFIDVHAFGIFLSCGVKITEELVCWGRTDFFELEPLISAFESIPMTQARFSGNTGCLMRPDGTAACYQSDNAQQAIAEFSSGPYKELFPLNSIHDTSYAYAACALTFNNELDCVETIEETGVAGPVLPLTVTRLPNTYKNVHANFRDLIGLTFDNKIESITREAENSTREIILTVNGELDMPLLSVTDAEYYGSMAGIELFFTALEIPRGSYILKYDTQIFRDGELLTVTDNFGSFLDRSATTQTEYTYEMRAVHPFGQTGEFSEPTTVSTLRNGPDTPIQPDPSRPNKPTGLRAEIYYHDVELFWDRNTSGAVNNYEIRRNGEPVGSTRGISWYDSSTQNGESYQFDVLAIGMNNEILGIETVHAQIGPAECN